MNDKPPTNVEFYETRHECKDIKRDIVFAAGHADKKQGEKKMTNRSLIFIRSLEV